MLQNKRPVKIAFILIASVCFASYSPCCQAEPSAVSSERKCIPQLIDSYCKDITERLKHLPNLNQDDFFNELIRFLAWVHHRFLWIHPFRDYNGRIARLLTNVNLLNLDLPPLELRIETKAGRDKYVKALKNADQGDYSKLEELIKAAIEETSEELIKFKEK